MKSEKRDMYPYDIPEWHALTREASLARHLMGAGATALGKANYADQKGEYYMAFFGLSVGLERIAKLIIVADYAIDNGKMPKEQKLRKFGHKLLELVNEVDKISKKRSLNLKYTRPNTEISKKILECLDAFADASRGRYANFSSLEALNLSNEDPIKKWWNEVGESVLQKYYYGKAIQKKVETNAEFIHLKISSNCTVIHTHESGEMILDVKSASIQTRKNEIVQKFGRFHALTIVRWLSNLLLEIAHIACYGYNIGGFSGINEFFESYIVGDKLLKVQKKWPGR